MARIPRQFRHDRRGNIKRPSPPWWRSTEAMMGAVLLAIGAVNPAFWSADNLFGLLRLNVIMGGDGARAAERLSSGFQMMRVSHFMIDFIGGAFLIAVLTINVLLNRRPEG